MTDDRTPAELLGQLTSRAAPRDPAKGWVIDVCSTCFRPATWPFCEHRMTDRRWTTAVSVKAAPSVVKRLLKDRPA